MTIRPTLRDIGWSRAALARATGVSDSTAARWIDGTYAVPARLQAWLDDLARYHRSNPAPGREDPPPGL